jgi:hypothetical protein
MARELAEKGTERVSPRDRGVASRLGVEPDSPELAAAERYLVLEDYIRPSSPDHKDGTFIITEFGWKDLGYQLSSEGWRVSPFGRGCSGSREGAAVHGARRTQHEREPRARRQRYRPRRAHPAGQTVCTEPC